MKRTASMLFLALLAVMYAVFPKQAGRHIGGTHYDGLVISEVMASNASAVPEDYSYGRSTAEDWRLFELSTPGQPNNAAGQARSEELYRAYNPTGVIISEVMASNSTVALGPTALTSDYVELYNTSSTTVDLTG
ncbi:MAG: lamin tail domain-containing protein, partial [Clostridiales bacterium]|nr:lamin tail domain-containing protein [Clostridiales bacterium]